MFKITKSRALNVCGHRNSRMAPDQLTVFSISGKSSALCFPALGVMGTLGAVNRVSRGYCWSCPLALMELLKFHMKLLRLQKKTLGQ